MNAVGIGSRTASGPLCVCRSVEEVAEKFHAGDVLVVPTWAPVSVTIWPV